MYGIFYGLYGAAAGTAQARASASAAEAAARRSESKAGQIQSDLALLNERLDKLVLLSMAMWSLLQEQTALTEQQLTDRAQDIDLRDGVLDGKITQSVVQKCDNCGRAMSRRHRRCLFCGGVSLSETPFESV